MDRVVRIIDRSIVLNTARGPTLIQFDCGLTELSDTHSSRRSTAIFVDYCNTAPLTPCMRGERKKETTCVIISVRTSDLSSGAC